MSEHDHGVRADGAVRAPFLRSLRLLFLALAVFLAPFVSFAHVGNPTMIYEGMAGSIPVRVSVKVPTVIPGLAEINVRILTNGVTRVTALPAHWQSGPEGMPPPDICTPVAGETNLYHTELWLMVRGAYSVNVTVETAQGSGKVLVPVNAIATTVLTMPKTLGGILIGLGVLLFSMAVASIGAAVRESVLEPGLSASRKRVWFGRAAMVLTAGVLALSLWGGWNWWQAKASEYSGDKLHKPARAQTELLNESTTPTLRLSLLPPEPADQRARVAGLVPDHGKLVHLFLIQQPDGAGFAHLHPVRSGSNYFESKLPALPAGRYHVYTDLTHESGFSQTLTSLLHVAASDPSRPFVGSDADDSWFVRSGAGTSSDTATLGNGLKMIWDRGERLAAGRETTLRFRVVDEQGQAVELEPYMSMLAHAIVWRDDGAVFTHLHPAGTVSVASQQVFQLRAGDKRPRRITPELMEALCQPPGTNLRRLPLSFPYEFPKPGRYRIWVQVKVGGEVRTATFAAEVSERGA